MKSVTDAIIAYRAAGGAAAPGVTELVACDNTYGPHGSASSTFEPDECFRFLGSGGEDPDYLAGYSLEISPVDAGVVWEGSAVNEMFEDHECESVTMMASDHLASMDICDMFDAEVDQAIDGDWNVALSFAFPDGDANTQWGWQATPEDPTADVFKTLWFDDDLDGNIKGEAADGKFTDQAAGMGGFNDLYEAHPAREGANLQMIWGHLLDEDDDPVSMIGDLGRVDLTGGGEANDEPDGMWDAGPNNNRPSGVGDDADVACSDDDGGDGCDAEWSYTADILFADGAFGCSTTKSLSFTCTWDADGRSVPAGTLFPAVFRWQRKLLHQLRC